MKCAQCDNLREGRIISYEDKDTPRTYGCMADVSILLNEDDIKNNRECSFFRSRTKTAWQEVKEDIFQTIPKAIKTMINYFVSK